MEGALVVGSGGLIGRSLMKRLPEFYSPVIGTVRRSETGDAPGSVTLDLSKEIPVELLSRLADSIRTAFLCAAIPRFEDCERDPNGSFLVNVRSIVRVADLLARRGMRIVFLSTNAVFSGDRRYPGEDAVPSPTTEYGRQKTEAETRLQALEGLETRGSHIIIARLTKVLSVRMALIRGWVDSLQRGQVIAAFDDLVFAPVSLGYATTALIRLSTSAAPGIYHISGAKDASYYEFARQLAETLGRSQSLVSPVKTPVCGQGWQIVKRGFSALAMKKTEPVISLLPQELKAVTKDIFKEWRDDK